MPPEYWVWQAMLKRCLKPQQVSPETAKHYVNISVCQRWQESFRNFIEDIGWRPGKEFILDRINNNGNYEPSNCRWATSSQQNNNKSSTKLITAFGKTQTFMDWVKEIGFTESTLRNRLAHGWDIEDALSRPVEPPRTSSRRIIHGTVRGYWRCGPPKCYDCKQANNAHQRQYRLSKKINQA